MPIQIEINLFNLIPSISPTKTGGSTSTFRKFKFTDEIASLRAAGVVTLFVPPLLSPPCPIAGFCCAADDPVDHEDAAAGSWFGVCTRVAGVGEG
ncbi:unnamed protein product [Phytophthora fragariaefolia]|uniref:Unnamed protein product n=1 Tax=Phytophthora fragariaefolia TaxID=1490495 RepID=A0A9W6UAT0_9STRA|nr:unnamed protein product [Phytophthora fragariaefolia]